MGKAELGGIEVGDGHPVAIIGVLNLSPESFYGGSVVRGPIQAVRQVKRMLRQGASIIDVGAMSTAPNVKPISVGLEEKRLLPVIKALVKETNAPISVDTQRAAIAEAALEAGARIINDVSGLKSDPNVANVVADFKCSAILMAARKKPGDARKMGEVRSALQDSLQICKRHSIDIRKVIIDPGIGFGKGVEWDVHILANLRKLKDLGRPICVAVSRKAFIGKILGVSNPADRLIGSLAATAIAVGNGADVVRTHDVQETAQVVRVIEAIQHAGKC
jgi:dihydropteroate synthase